MGDVLDPQTPVLVTVEDPPWFENLVREWEQRGNTSILAPEEREYRPDEEGSTERTEAQRTEFARFVRDSGHQADLERTDQHPVIKVALTPPGGFPVQKPAGQDSAAIHVTRAARHRIETGPIPAVPAGPATQVITVGTEDAPEDKPRRGRRRAK
jgi:hypothetical protein